MKRNQRLIQQQVDVAVKAAINEGGATNETLSARIWQIIRDCPHSQLEDNFVSVELSSCKQRLRREGLIEMVADNEPVSVENLTPTDVAVVDARQLAHITGRLQSRAIFNHQHGRMEECEMALRQLAVFSPELSGELREQLALGDSGEGGAAVS